MAMIRGNEVGRTILKNSRNNDANIEKENVPANKIPRPTARRRVSCSIHPLLQGPQQITSGRPMPIRMASKSCLSEFTQRVMSGKLLQLKQCQNQLVEAQTHLQMVKEENKALTRLLKRHEVSLRRYEGENAGMPRLLRGHAEEVRTLRSNVHQLKTELHEVQGQLREKETEVVSLKDALAKLRALANANKVFDQEKAMKRIDELQGLAEEQNREIQLLSRKILLETKNHQRLLHTEVSQRKETKKTLDEALITIEKLEKQKRALMLGQTKPNNLLAPHQCQPSIKTKMFQASQGVGDSQIHNKNYNRKSLVPIARLKTPAHPIIAESVQHRPNFQPQIRLNTPII